VARACIRCEAVLSPWEGSICLTCKDRIVAPRNLASADAAVRVLEREERPIRVYDIARAIYRDLGRRTPVSTLQLVLSRDLRFCWAGKGLYGLYRHRLFPGPRNLAGLAQFLLFASGSAIHPEQLAFVMKFLGYRFQDQSLRTALMRESAVEWDGSRCVITPDDVTRQRLFGMGFAPTVAEFDRMVLRGKGLFREGQREYVSRVRGETLFVR
jgi:hypothetical protein